MNAYADVTSLKSAGVLNIQRTTYDTRLRELLERVSRLIDRYCNRHFYVLATARKFDGDGGTNLNVQDLISITSVKTDDDRDRVFETTWAATDYLLYPPNADPTTPWGRPYSRVVIDTEAGNESVFTAGMQTVEINGKWGYREITEDSGADIDEGAAFSDTDTTLTTTDDSKFGVAQTIAIESEQIYIVSIWRNDLIVARGVNGTTAAAHADGTDISIYRYPGPVVEACLMQAARLWKRKDSWYASSAGLPQTGQSGVFHGLDPDVKQLLGPYRKLSVGVGTW